MELGEFFSNRDRKIINTLGMANLPMIVHILHKKYKGKVKFIDIGGDCMIRYGCTNIANMSYLPVILHFLEIKNEKIKLEGNVSIPYAYRERCMFSVCLNDVKQEVFLYDAGGDKRDKKGNKYELCTAFSAVLPLEFKENILKISFHLTTDGIESICNKINSMRFMPVADVIAGQYAEVAGYIITINNGCMIVEKADESCLKKKEEEYNVILKNIKNKYMKEGKTKSAGDVLEALQLRRNYFQKIKNKKKPLFLVMDRIDRAGDNGEMFFRYLRKEHSEVDSYFVIDESSSDYAKLKVEFDGIIPAFSSRHLMLLLLSDAVISSQCNGAIENPFYGKAEYLRDLYHNTKRVFLQHGIIKDDMSTTLNRFNTGFYGFITSTRREYESILEYPYGYSENEVWLTGLPRYDVMKDKSHETNEKLILLMPTWRMGMMHQKWSEEKKVHMWVPNRSMERSAYFKKWKKVLDDVYIRKICRKYGFKILFIPHPLTKSYMKNITEWNDEIKWGGEYDYQTVIEKASLMVTDYSSIAFDFGYLRKPVVYYQFDRDEFFKTHTYKKGYFDYSKDGFGEVAENHRELVELICWYMKSGCNMKSEYKANADKVFKYITGDSCRRIYEKITKEGER